MALCCRKAEEKKVQLAPLVHLLLQTIDQIQEKDQQMIFAEPVDLVEVGGGRARCMDGWMAVCLCGCMDGWLSVCLFVCLDGWMCYV